VNYSYGDDIVLFVIADRARNEIYCGAGCDHNGSTTAPRCAR
jgi:hypothetical protein